MEHKIVEKGEIRIVGNGIRTRIINEEHYRDISAFWDEPHKNGFIKQLVEQAGDMGLFGICKDFDEKDKSYTYFIGVEKPTSEIPNGWEEVTVPPSTWAVFPSKGQMPDAIRNVWDRIFTEWFPASTYERAGTPEMEIYPNGVENDTDENYICEVWIPIIKK
ncbi:GyrI-like domain-containing protein [Fervidibacillus albus]|uniref:GyrI-like domain-containing protein n=1 Tax=Fervidibacillus albus TaxID=2980026 RepID=A0A9E8RUS9_9BACI|nr:GyrI-like domain-containing protein [Fervidibacillus albus]WAA08564.1 GyrI-like domain-containing protein [Fervidibacillus albus]